jgi:DNA-binding transcriptional regulator YiaG
MNEPIKLQVIRSLQGTPEYVLIPIAVYNALRAEIEEEIAGLEAVREDRGEYLSFRVEDYVTNPIAQARIKAGITQGELAKRMQVSQPYIAKLERQERVTAKLR